MDGEIAVMATVNLPGLRAGQFAVVTDVDRPYIQACLTAGYLIPLPHANQPTDREENQDG